MMNIQTHLMFDLETLGLYENAVVLSLAVVPFTLEEISSKESLLSNSFYCKFSVKEQMEIYNRSTTESTIDFWRKQSKSVFDSQVAPLKSDVYLASGLSDMSSFIQSSFYDWKTSFVWSRGSYFDFPKIESMYLQCGLTLPFNSWKIRDVRTAIDVLLGSIDGQYVLKNRPDELEKHNCLHDCLLDVLSLQEIVFSLKG